MSAGLKDLLERMREHPAFPELLKGVEAPMLKSFKASEDAQKQTSDWIFQSGRRLQNEIWRQFLTEFDPPQKEKP